MLTAIKAQLKQENTHNPYKKTNPELLEQVIREVVTPGHKAHLLYKAIWPRLGDATNLSNTETNMERQLK